MKLTTFILIIALAQVSAKGLAQKITLNTNHTPIEKVLQSIREQSGYEIFYDVKDLKDQKVTLKIDNVSIEDAIRELTKDLPLSYKIVKNNIVLTRVEPSLLDRLSATVKAVFKSIDVKGKVTDQDGKPLPNASIRVKGKNTVINTNSEGLFELKGVEEDAVLLVSYVGFKTLEISLQGAVMPLEIKLNVSTGELEEVKVVYNTGYQELNKERATGSFVHIDNELFNRRVGARVLDRINDLVPGLLKVETEGGSPLNNYRIRGQSTINASKAPLLVVDNFIFNGNPNDLNPNDIESVTILKDAAAASIWGARAGNGVIVITSKKGKISSKPNVSFNTNLTIGEKPDLYSLPVISSSTFIALERKRFAQGFYDSSLSDKFSYPALSQVVEILAKQRTGMISQAEADNQIAVYENHDVRKDIDKYLSQTSIAQQYSLGISGGSDNYQYYGSVGYDKDRPNDINIVNNRFTIGFNNIWNPIKNLQINAQLNWIQSINENNNGLSGGYKAVLTSPYHRLADENGNALAVPNKYRTVYADTVSFPGKLDWMYRPLDEAGNGNNLNKAYSTRINGSVRYDIISGLKIEVGYNWQKGISESIAIKGVNTFATRDLINRFTQKGPNNLPSYPYPLGGTYDQSNADQLSWSYRGSLSFNRSFEKHAISSILGTERNESKSRSLLLPTQFGYNPETNVFGSPQIGSWITRPNGSSSSIGTVPNSLLGNLTRFGSYYGNVGYTYDQKYTLTGSARIDESNYFGVEANDRKVPLWSAGLKWDISKETFYKIDQLPILSIRATYGYSGNTSPGVSPLVSIRYSSPSEPLFVPFAAISTSPNPELKWEKVRTINLALDFGIKDQKISGSLEFYHKRSTDLISDITVDPTSGFTQYTGNSSSLQTRGIDLNLNSRNVNGEFKWYSALNFSFQEDKIIAYTINPPPRGRYAGIFIGKPQSSIYGGRWAGLNPLTGDAQFYVGEQIVGSTYFQNNQKQADLEYVGQTIPPMFGSFRNDFRFKNISLSLNISYQLGHYFRRQTFNGSFEASTFWVHDDYLMAWQKPGDELATTVPGFLNVYPDQRYSAYSLANILIEKGDHIRLQDVRLDYQVNKNIFKKLPVKNVSFYAYANNLGFIWKASEYNPDTSNGSTINQTPKTLAFGLSVAF